MSQKMAKRLNAHFRKESGLARSGVTITFNGKKTALNNPTPQDVAKLLKTIVVIPPLGKPSFVDGKNRNLKIKFSNVVDPKQFEKPSDYRKAKKAGELVLNFAGAAHASTLKWPVMGHINFTGKVVDMLWNYDGPRLAELIPELEKAQKWENLDFRNFVYRTPEAWL